MNNSKLESNINAILASPEKTKRYLELDRLLYKYEPDPNEPDPTEWDIIEEILRYNSLNLKRANLESIPSLVFELEHLQELDLSGNSLTEIPPDIRNLKRLKSLHLNNNWLTSLPIDIGKLGKLEKLYLQNNRLKVLPAEIAELDKLDELYLSNNPVRKLIPLLFHNARGLKSLGIETLAIKRIPHAIYDLSKLRFLSISSSHVPEVDFRRFDSLHSVHIYGEAIDIEGLKEEYRDCGIYFTYCGDETIYFPDVELEILIRETMDDPFKKKV